MQAFDITHGNKTEMDLNDRQVKTLIVLNVLDLIQYVLLLAFTLHNTVRYLCHLNIKNKLIIIFYILTYIIVTFKMLENISRIAEPKLYYYDF